MNLLLDHGHPAARRYPLGMVWDEASLVVDRLNGLEATRGILTQMAVSSLFSEDARTDFRSLIEKMSEG